MWRKAFYTLLCWLALSPTSGETVNTVNSSVVKDVNSAESAPRLYRNDPFGVYASAAPYASYSFHIPAFVTAPNSAASRIVPVINNANGYLRDSYGNRFVETPQSVAYKTAFPQQFLPLQALPAHLTQPLVASASQAKQPSPHYFVGTQYRGPTFQVTPHTSSVHSFTGFSQPIIYAQNLRSSHSPSSVPTHTQSITVQQQPSSNKVVYVNTQENVKFQRLQQPFRTEANPTANGALKSHEDKAQIQAAPATVTAIVNGKKTVVNIETKPPVPLLDLSLLEPLTFDNPLVPQVQHFLPRINDATYHKLLDFNVNEGKNKKEFTAQKTKLYDSGIEKIKSPPKKIPQQPSVPSNDDVISQNPHSARPTITVKGTPNQSPEISYEINSPNYKETYNEKSVSYNKASDDHEPLTYSYDEKTQSQPITYSYTKTELKKPVSYRIEHDSDEPNVVKHIMYNGNGQDPKQLIYKFKPEEQSQVQNDRPVESEDAGSAEETSEESDSDGPSNSYHNHDILSHPHPPSHSQQQGHTPSHHLQNHPQSQNYDGIKVNHNEPRHGYDHRPKVEYHPNHPQQSHSYTRNNHARNHPHPSSHKRNEDVHRDPGHNYRPTENYNNNHQSPRSHGKVNHSPEDQVYHKQSYTPPEHRTQEIKVPVQTQYPVTQQFEEHIRIVPSDSPAPAAIVKETTNKGVKGNDDYDFRPSPLSTLEDYQKFIEHQMRSQQAKEPPQLHNSAAPVILEQGKRIIIQEESPEEMHSHQEQNVRAEMINEDGNNEEEFEKAYKNAAYGFPAFEDKPNDQAKDFYNPETYDFPREHNDFNIEKNPFQVYQAEGDNFPKSLRANYKEARDNTKDNYYLDYSVHKPESMADLYQNKANYFKLYKKYKPEKYFSIEQDKKKEKKSGKYTVLPSFDFNSRPEKKQNYFAQYKNEPIKYEYKFAKESPRDNSAHASHPFQRLKSKTHFVEPQFQYGFEPIALPRLLDSELAAMATNDSPETEKPGLRKKIYKENWYIKKTSTSGGKPS